MPGQVGGELDSLERRILYEEFSGAGILMKDAGPWIDAKSKEIGVPPRRIRGYLAHERCLELEQVREKTATGAQRVANLIGSSVAAALETLSEGLAATVMKKHFDRHGSLVDEYEVPAWEARHGAAVAILKVHGGFAPDRVEFESNDPADPKNMTEDQIKAKLAQLRNAVE